MFGRGKSGNWRFLKGLGFGETSDTRDVQGSQVLERGERANQSSKTPRVVVAVIFALLVAGLGYGVGMFFMAFLQLFNVLVAGESIVGFAPDFDLIMLDFKLIGFTVAVFLVGGLIIYERLIAGWRSENVMADATDINPHLNDQHVMLDEEMQERFDYFPDAGAHSAIQVSSMLSHMMLSNKGLKKIKVPKRHTKDFIDKDGQQQFKGAVVHDSDGNVIFETQPLIDEKFGQDLLTASEIPIGREAADVRKAIDVRGIPYNLPVDGDKRKKNPQRRNREKLNYDTVDDFINDDWEVPAYEVQRPAGAYLVDTAPVNTMVLAITRGGKGTIAPVI